MGIAHLITWKNIGALVCCLAAILGFSPISCAGEERKVRVAILDFQLEDWPEGNSQFGHIVSEWVTFSTVSANRVHVLERHFLKKVLAEQQLAMSGIVEDEHLTVLGKILGVEAIIVGTVLMVGQGIEVFAEVVDSGDASILAVAKIKADSQADLEGKIPALVDRLLAAFPL